MTTSVLAHNMAGGSAVAEKAVELLARELDIRAGVVVERAEADAAQIVLAIEDGIGTEGFRIEDHAQGVRVVGNDERGLLYGVGKLLREGEYDDGSFVSGAWRGTSVPEKPMRAMYFATHFYNFYHAAPVEEVNRYIEELALWGCNALFVWFDMHHYNGIDDPEAQEMIARLKAFLKTANAVGMGAGFLFLANEGYANSPEDQRADWRGGQNGYHHPPVGHYRTEICPHLPGGLETILSTRREVLEAFADVDLDYICIWPYDQGGCTCEKCAPWGSRGILACLPGLAAQVKEFWPRGKVILSTWDYDVFTDGEFDGLRDAFAEMPPENLDYLLADVHSGEWPVKHFGDRSPGGLPVVGFPEVSMALNTPWGGYGANPRPVHWQAYWNQVKDYMSGSLPYSEGLYEDLNKILILQMEWAPERSADEIVREYAAYEFGANVADDVVRICRMLESDFYHNAEITADDGHVFNAPNAHEQMAGKREIGYTLRYKTFRHDHVEDCEALMRAVNDRMRPVLRDRWRWRLVYIRARLDAQILAHDGAPTDETDALFDEMVDTFFLHNTIGYLLPPSRKQIALLIREREFVRV